MNEAVDPDGVSGERCKMDLPATKAQPFSGALFRPSLRNVFATGFSMGKRI